jgi:hypothetical protein
MDWLSALSALAQIVLVILEMARDRQTKDAGRAEALAEAATHALDLIRKGRDARRAAADTTRDPDRLRDDDGFRRD